MRKFLVALLSVTLVLLLNACGLPCKTHDFAPWEIVSDATCTAEGLKTRTCTACDATEEEVIPVAAHTYGEWVIEEEPTCAMEGAQSHICQICNASELVAIPALPHTFGEWKQITAPGCEEVGMQQHICEICNYEENEELAALGHEYKSLVCIRCKDEEYRVCKKNKFYDTDDGLSIKLTAFTKTKKEGYNLYRIQYTIKNITEDSKIVHGMFRLHLSDGTYEQMYGTFPYLYYKDSYNFFYDWKLMKDQEVLFAEYVPYDTHSAYSTPVEDAPHWVAP